MMLPHRFLPAAFGILAIVLSPALARADAIDDYIQAEMTRQRIPGLVLGVMRDGKLIRKQAYGLADLERNVPTRPDMLFEIGSATKSFTAMATLMLVEEGKVTLDDPAVKYLPSLPEAWNKITVRQLLNHTSGLPEFATIPEFTITEEVDRDKMIPALGKLPLDFVPGTAYSYTNTGFILLGMLIEKVSGKPYETFLQERILTPLQMTHTRSSDPDTIIPERAGRYFQIGTDIINSKPTQPSAGYSAGLLLSNVEDMAKWDNALREHKLLKASSYDAWWTPLRLASGGTRPYGLGWFTGRTNGHRVIWHPGNSAGYSASLTRFPDDNLSVIVLLNLYPVSADALARGVAQRIVPALAPSIPQEQTDPDPKRTERLRNALTQMAEGQLSPDIFAPEFIAPLATSRGQMQRQGMAIFKTVTKFAYAGTDTSGPNPVYLYRGTTPTRTFTFRFVLLSDGKISDVLAQADPPAQAQTPPAQSAQPGTPASTPPAPTGVAQIKKDATALLTDVRQDITKAFLKAASGLPEVTSRQLLRDPVSKKFYTKSEAATLDEARRKALAPVTVGESFYYNTKYGSPLAYARPLEILGAAGIKGIAGKKILDFGYGTVGHLRLLARCGADAVGVDVDPILSALYADQSDQGPIPGATGCNGSIKLVDGQFPATKPVRDAVGGGYDLIISKNTLKNGYLHPTQPVDKALLVDLGVDEPVFVRALYDALKPGGKLLIYNLSPAPSKPGEPYKPWADGKSPFTVAQWEAAGFNILAFDRDDSKAARQMGHTLGWDSGPGAMDLENDLFAHYTLVEKPLNPPSKG